MGQDPIEKILTWKDLALMSMGFTFPVGIFGLPPLVAAAVSCIIFGIAHLDPSVANPTNKKERKAAFIASLVIGVLAGYVSTIYFGPLASVTPPPLILAVFAISVMNFTSYGSKLGWWSLKSDKDPINKLLTLKDLALMSMGFTFPVGIFGFPPLVAFAVSCIIFGISYLDPSVANPKNIEERKVAFITSLVIGVLVGYVSTIYFAPLASVTPPPLILTVLAISVMAFTSYGSKLGWWSLKSGPLEWFPNQWVNWRDLFLFVMAFTFPLAIFDSGVSTVLGAIVATIFYAITSIFKFDKKVSFITSLVAGVVAALAILTQTYKETGFEFASPVFAIALSFFINYMSIAFDVPIAGGLITLLFSIIPALAVRKNIGLNMLISSIVSTVVYFLLVKDAKNKREPWMWTQSAYIGMLIGSSVAIFTKGLTPDDLISKSKELMGAGVLPSSDSVSEIVAPFNLVTSYLWLIYLVIWIMTQAKAPMPYKWNTLFKVK